MSRYRLTQPADLDLSEIWSYIAEDSLEAADRVENAIYSACATVAKSPGIGHTRANLTERPIRFWTVQPYRSYLIVYDPATRPVQILRIVHGSRNLRAVLKSLV